MNVFEEYFSSGVVHFSKLHEFLQLWLLVLWSKPQYAEHSNENPWRTVIGIVWNFKCIYDIFSFASIHLAWFRSPLRDKKLIHTLILGFFIPFSRDSGSQCNYKISVKTIIEGNLFWIRISRNDVRGLIMF